KDQENREEAEKRPRVHSEPPPLPPPARQANIPIGTPGVPVDATPVKLPPQPAPAPATSTPPAPAAPAHETQPGATLGQEADSAQDRDQQDEEKSKHPWLSALWNILSSLLEGVAKVILVALLVAAVAAMVFEVALTAAAAIAIAVVILMVISFVRALQTRL